MTDYWVKLVIPGEAPICIKSHGENFLEAIERARHKILEHKINLDNVSKYIIVPRPPRGSRIL